MPRRAVILMNLGGPDAMSAVQPFLYNLFRDPAIIRLPAPLRLPLARLVAARRAPAAREIYQRLGGKSPLLANTEAQARALEARLGEEWRCFIAMRYWHPLTVEAVRQVVEWQADEVLCLPLYPQFSTTTTASSLHEWAREAKRQGLASPMRAICCYPRAAGFVEAAARLVLPALQRLTQGSPAVRLLFSAHGLPQRIVRAGDPYPAQVGATASAIVAALGQLGVDVGNLDWRVCYQSRVGPLEWIGPSIDAEIRSAGAEKRAVIVAPISFVSEHSETLVELDLDYRRLAAAHGVPTYERVATVGIEPGFIDALADLVADPSASHPLAGGDRGHHCSGRFGECPLIGGRR